MKVVVLDLCKIEICIFVDLYLLFKLGIDVVVFNGLFNFVYINGSIDVNCVYVFVDGLDDVVVVVNDMDIDSVS